MADKTSLPGHASPAQASTPRLTSPAATASSPPASPGAATPTATAAPVDTGVMEADENAGDDADSALGFPTNESDTTSIRTFVFERRRQNGRTYHAFKTGGEYKSYFLPNDEWENERLDLQHNLMLLMQGNELFTCPALKEKPPQRVFDAGCGTGIWALEFGDMYPESAVVGIDISSIQPSMVAPNVEFFIDDLEETWNFVHPFDFIYARMLTGSIKDWPKFFVQSFQHLNPGGWVEACDLVCPLLCDDGTLPEKCAVKEWDRHCLEATAKIGAPFDSARLYEQQMKDAGFQNVTVVKYKWPLNTWPKDPKHKELGWWAYHNLMSGISALSMMSFTQALGWSPEQVEVFLAEVRKDIKNRNIHAYWPIYIVYGQKPE